VLKKIQVTAAPNVGTPALFFLVQNRHTRWEKVWLFAGCPPRRPSLGIKHPFFALTGGGRVFLHFRPDKK